MIHPSSFPLWEGRQPLCLPRTNLPPPPAILWSTLNLYSGQINIQCLHYYVHVAILHRELPVTVVLGLYFSLLEFLMFSEVNKCSIFFICFASYVPITDYFPSSMMELTVSEYFKYTRESVCFICFGYSH